MSIQILKQRPWKDPKTGTIKKPMTFPKNKLLAESVPELFLNIEKYIDPIPESERYNLHYSLCECKDDEKPRKFLRQNVIAFDLDGINVDLIDDYIDPVLSAIGSVSRGDVGIVASGRGLHFLIACETYWEKQSYFKETKEAYGIVCERIERRLSMLDLSGKVDRGIWSAGHTLRLPLTRNIKTEEQGFKDNFEGECTLIQRVINPIPDLDILSLAGVQPEEKGESVEVRTVYSGGFYDPDTKGILSECEFLKWANQNQAEVVEPQWYAMLSVVSHLEEGRKLAHSYSENHPQYSPEETDDKIDQALASAGPRTCENINALWGKCSSCPHYKKITSPITIKSKDYIKTKKTGFREVKINPQTGQPTPGPINYEDLRRYFATKHDYVATESRFVYTWDGTQWNYFPDVYIESFVQDHVVPAPNSNHCREFVKLMQRTNVVLDSWFDTTTENKLNLQNGILDLTSGEPKLIKHSKKVGFRHTLPYSYDPDAKSPLFDRFMKEVTQDRLDLENVLLEFAGYAFANQRPEYAKALILLGEGANGKSTFLECLQDLAGGKGYSALNLKDLGNEQMRSHLVGKMFNVAEETPSTRFVDSSIFKDLVTGGTVTAKVVYKAPIHFKNKTKLMMAANRLPAAFDSSKGFLRRLLIVPFDAEFYRGNRDTKLKEKLQEELPGILNRVLEGYKRLESQGHFTDSETIEQEVQNYRYQIDPVLNFCREGIVLKDIHASGGCYTTELYRAYKVFCVETGIKNGMSRREFLGQFRKHVKDLKQRATQKGRHKTTYYRGIEIIKDEMPQFSEF